MPTDHLPMEENAHLEDEKGESQNESERRAAAPKPEWPWLAGEKRQRAGHQRRDQISEDQRIEDRAAFERGGIEQRVVAPQ